MTSEFMIDAEGLSKRYPLGRVSVMNRGAHAEGVDRSSLAVDVGKEAEAAKEFWALQDVSFRVQQGETVGIIGRNGAGKSTLLKLLAGVTEPSKGRARMAGRVGSLLEVGAGFHADLTGRDNVFLVGSILGMKRRETLRSFDDILAFSGVEPFIDTPVKKYSSGMYLRLAFSVAAHLSAEILLIDEALAVGDQAFRDKCVAKLRDLARDGRTVLFVSHDPGSILRLCDRALLLDKGRLIGDGPANEILQTYNGSLRSATQSYRVPVSTDATHIVSVTQKENDSAPNGVHRSIATSIELHVADTNDAEGLNVLLEVIGADLWAVTGSIGRIETTTIGVHEINCRIPDLRVTPGRYTLTVTLRQFDRVIETIPQLCAFDVEDPNADSQTATWRYIEDATWSSSS